MALADYLNAAYRGAMQGGTLGWGDEIMGGLSAAYARAMRPDLFADQPFGDTYRQGRDTARDADAQAQTAAPATYGLSQLLSGLAVPAAGMGSSHSLARMARVGAGYGGAAGAGYSTATSLSDLLTDAGTGAATGAVVAPALGTAARYISNGPGLSAFLADETGSVPMPGGKNLPMDYASRMARAKEMGFDTDRVWYHGTSADFPEFNAWNPPNAGGLTAKWPERATFLTADPAEASQYALDSAVRRTVSDPRDWRQAEGANVLPVFMRANDQLVVSDMPEYSARQVSRLVDKARADGYQSVLFKNMRDGDYSGDQLAVLDGKILRSPTATFDPAQAYSADLLAATRLGVPVSLTGAGGLSAYLAGRVNNAQQGKPK